MLKEIFEDRDFVRENNICSINSINWARIAVQSTYFVWAYLQVYGTPYSIGQEVNFSIPTGAFGNAMGGYVAKLMGIPISKIICATNVNDIVHRVISRGDFSMGSNVATHSPAMDIQFAYNLERMLFYMCNQNPVCIRDIMRRIDDQFAFKKDTEGVTLDRLLLRKVQELFVSCSVDDMQTLETIKRVKNEDHFDLCPHSAIGVFAAQVLFKDLAISRPTFCVLTANAAKFEDSFREATGVSPSLQDVESLKSKPHKYIWLRKADEGWREEWIAKLKNDILVDNNRV